MKKKSIIILTIIAIFVLITAFSSCYCVNENEYAYVIRFSKIERIEKSAGLHFKIPFMDSVKFFPKNIQLYDLAPSDVLTSDSKTMSVDSYVLWKISDPMTFYKTLGSIPEAQNRLDAATYNALKNIIGTMSQDSIITPSVDDGRNDLNVVVHEQVKSSTTDYGIEITDVKIKRFDLPTENEEAVYQRMISDRNQTAEKYRAEGSSEATKMKNDVDKQVNIIVSDAKAQAEEIVAEGEKQYIKLLAETFNTVEKENFYIFMRSLDTLKTSLTGEQKTIILGADSELAKILQGLE
ncbi:MAG: protease modulator HflC [Clostridiales bacterium]|jgi:hflC protein|nr:protease modulator HflC [Clostridiales bacterium]